MFAYCGNNPVIYIDSEGNRPIVTATVAEETVDDRTAACFVMNTWMQYYTVQSFPSDTQHFERNTYNILPHDSELFDILEGNNPEWKQLPWYGNIFHMLPWGPQGFEAIYNKKYMSGDNHYEVIICYDPQHVPEPYIVIDEYNRGTYNYGSNPWDHFVKDMLPYFLLGN